MWNRKITLAWLAIFLLAACAERAPGVGTQAQPDIFLPPSSQPATATLSPTIPVVTKTPHTSPTPLCTDNLTFQEDVSIPDGTVVTARQELDKRWQVKNSGSCNWDERYRLKLVAGPEMGAGKEQALFPARSGTDLEIQIIFTAPSEPGTYRSAWQAYTPTGEPFGDVVFIEVIVR